MKMRAEQGVAGYAPQVARPQNADVVLIYMRGQAVRTTLNENVMARL